jgi:hypothetical protein
MVTIIMMIVAVTPQRVSIDHLTAAASEESVAVARAVVTPSILIDAGARSSVALCVLIVTIVIPMEAMALPRATMARPIVAVGTRPATLSIETVARRFLTATRCRVTATK